MSELVCNKHREIFDAFKREHKTNATELILDGTGPCVSMHFPNLALFSFFELQSLAAIHAFSGGVFAYLSILARENNYLCHAPQEYAHNLDKAFRGFHHRNLLSLPKAVVRYSRKGSLFGAAPLLSHIRYVFKPDFLDSDIRVLPRNFKPYLNDLTTGRAIQIDTAKGGMTVLQLLFTATSVPFLYRDESMPNWSDVVYSKDFKRVYFGVLKSNGPKIVSTMWKSGRSTDSLYLSTVRPGLARRRLISDIAKLVLNVPNNNFRREMESGFVTSKI